MFNFFNGGFIANWNEHAYFKRVQEIFIDLIILCSKNHKNDWEAVNIP